MIVTNLVCNIVFFRSILIYNTSARYEPDRCDTSATWMRHKWDMSDTSAKRFKNSDFDNDTNEDIFSHPYISYMANERLQGEKEFYSKKYLLKMA